MNRLDAWNQGEGPEPLYQAVGREPLSDADLAAAIKEWEADNPGADELQRWGAANRLRRENAKARKRAEEQAEAEASGTTVEAMRQARAEALRRAADKARLRDLDVARKAIGAPRKKGRPRLTEQRVRDDLERALSQLRDARGISVPTSWEQLAAAHDGADAFGMTRSGLDKRRQAFPRPFEDLVPNLIDRE